MFKNLVKVGLLSILAIGSLNAAEEVDVGSLYSFVNGINSCEEAKHLPTNFTVKFGDFRNGVIQPCKGNLDNLIIDVSFSLSKPFNKNNPDEVAQFINAWTKESGVTIKNCQNNGFGYICNTRDQSAPNVWLNWTSMNNYNKFTLNITKIK